MILNKRPCLKRESIFFFFCFFYNNYIHIACYGMFTCQNQPSIKLTENELVSVNHRKLNNKTIINVSWQTCGLVWLKKAAIAHQFRIFDGCLRFVFDSFIYLSNLCRFFFFSYIGNKIAILLTISAIVQIIGLI